MDTFLYALEAVLPLLLTMALGYVVRRFGHWDAAFFKKLNGLCFHLFLPINLFFNVYTVDDLSKMNWRIMGFLVLAILLALALGWIAAALLVPDRRQKGVVIQAAFRANHAIMGLPLAESLGGAAAMGFASLATAVCVPTFNLLAVLTLSNYSGAERPKFRKQLRSVVQNPLIVATLLGVLCLIVRVQLGLEQPLLKSVPAVYNTVQNLSRVASPIMLFVLGAGLDFKSIGKLLPQLSLSVILRLVLAPALAIGLALALREPLGLTTVEMPAILATCASPVAVSSAVMTQEIGGDDQLASQIVAWSSVFSMLTIFVLVYFLRTIGAL